MSGETNAAIQYEWLLDFVVRVKNLRGVVFVPDREPEAQLAALRWIGRKFRYRDIGYHPNLKQNRPRPVAKRLDGQPYVPVDFPAPQMSEACELLRPESLPEELWRATCLASLFACPLILTGAPVEIPPVGIVFRVTSDGPLDTASAKFHLRVCDYAAVDWFAGLTREVLALVGRQESTAGVPELVARRREFALKDGEKRFWRLADRGEERAVILTVDPLALSWAERAARVVETLRKFGPLAACLLSLVPVFCVEPGATVEA